MGDRWRTGAVATGMSIIGIVGGAAIFYLWDPSTVGLIEYRISVVSVGWEMRVSEWLAAWKAFLASPILGNGFGYPIHIRWTGEDHPQVHNIGFLLLKDTGIVGLALYGAAFTRALRDGLRGDRSLASPVILLSLGAYGMVSSMLRTAVGGIYVGIAIGLCCAAGRRPRWRR
jgi:O-antigen ligase